MNKIQDYLTSYYSQIIEKGHEYYEELDTVLINLNKELWYDKCIKGNKKHIHLVMLNVNMEEIEELGKKDEVVINHLSYEEEQEKLRRSEIHEAIDEGIVEGINKTAINMLKDNMPIDVK